MENSLVKPFRIGRVILRNNLVMAPIAGTTSAPFRTLCQRFGAGLTVSELTSAAGLVYDRDFVKNRRYLSLSAQPEFDAVQLFGADPAQMGEAVRRLFAHPDYGRYALLDINMGCPVPKVMKTGAGAALMSKQETAAELVRRAVDAAAGRPVTVKIRSGLDESSLNAPSFARAMQDAGAAAVCLHARTARQRYAGRADYAMLERVRDAVSVPLIGSGDLLLASELPDMAAAGADAFMVGRAAIGQPWVFAELTGGTPLTDAARCTALKELVQALAALLGERTALAEVRPQLGAAVRGRPNAAHWRQRLFGAETVSRLLREIDEAFGCTGGPISL